MSTVVQSLQEHMTDWQFNMVHKHGYDGYGGAGSVISGWN